MRDLLLAIQSALRAGLDSTVYRLGTTPDNGDVFISEQEDYFPPACEFPAVGIKDGLEIPLQRNSCGDGLIEEVFTQTVNLIAWAPTLSSVIGAGIIGDATQPGVCRIKDDIHGILNDNFLGDLGVSGVERGQIAPSRIMQQQEGRLGQFLVIPYTYTRKRKVPARL